MRNQFRLLMDRSSFYILKNRYLSSSIISLLIFTGTLLFIDLLLIDQPKIEKFQSISLTIIKEKPIAVPNSIPEPTRIPKQRPELTKKTDLPPESIPSPKPELSREVQTKPEPVHSFKSIHKTEYIPESILTAETKPIIKPRLTPFKTVSSGLNLPQPNYPKSAIRWKKQGIVEVEIEINPDGSIKKVKLIKSSGHAILDNQCINIINKKWNFSRSNTIKITRKRFVFKLL